MKINKKFIDLFSGIGGFRVAFEQAGFECVFSSEIDEKAQITYKENFNEVPDGDIAKISVAKIPNHDVLLAGFPCQPFSIAGKREGVKDRRFSVFYHIKRILRAKKPPCFLLENVKGLVYLNKSEGLKKIVNELSKIGYNISYKVMNTKDYSNIPQNRERVFIVGFLKDNEFDFPSKTKSNKAIKSILLNKKQNKKFYYNKTNLYPRLRYKVTSKKTIYQWRKYYIRENKSNVCPTLTANMGTGGHNVPIIKDKWGIRKLTPRECLSFQGFPLSFKLPDIALSHLYKQIGNSVSVPVVFKIAQQIKRCLK